MCVSVYNIFEFTICLSNSSFFFSLLFYHFSDYYVQLLFHLTVVRIFDSYLVNLIAAKQRFKRIHFKIEIKTMILDECIHKFSRNGGGTTFKNSVKTHVLNTGKKGFELKMCTFFQRDFK